MKQVVLMWNLAFQLLHCMVRSYIVQFVYQKKYTQTIRVCLIGYYGTPSWPKCVISWRSNEITRVPLIIHFEFVGIECLISQSFAKRYLSVCAPLGNKTPCELIKLLAARQMRRDNGMIWFAILYSPITSLTERLLKWPIEHWYHRLPLVFVVFVARWRIPAALLQTIKILSPI